MCVAVQTCLGTKSSNWGLVDLARARGSIPLVRTDARYLSRRVSRVTFLLERKFVMKEYKDSVHEYIHGEIYRDEYLSKRRGSTKDPLWMRLLFFVSVSSLTFAIMVYFMYVVGVFE